MQCLVTDGDINKLVSAMMDILQSMSDAVYENITNSYEDVLARLVKARSNWDETLRNARSPDDEESRQPSNPYKTLMKQLHDWLHKLPVIGFNSGKYDQCRQTVPRSLLPVKERGRRRRNGTGRQRRRRRRRERWRRVIFCHQTQQHVHVSVDG